MVAIGTLPALVRVTRVELAGLCGKRTLARRAFTTKGLFPYLEEGVYRVNDLEDTVGVAVQDLRPVIVAHHGRPAIRLGLFRPGPAGIA